MNLLEQIFGVADLRGEIALWKKGQGSVFYDLSRIDEIQRDYAADQADWYFHVATHDSTRITHRGSIKSAQQFTTLWADLDLATKSTAKYPTIAEVQNMLEIMDTAGLKPSAMVNSGNGLHAYWFLDKPYEADEYTNACKSWIGYLNQLLSTIVTDRKCIIDQTGDMARLLRIPGTRHSTSGKLVNQMWCEDRRFDLEKLLALTDYYTRKQSGSTKAKMENKVLESMGMIQSSIPTYISNIVESCEQVKYFIDEEGKVEEPVWYAHAGLFPFSEDGLEIFMELSQQADAHMDSDRSESGTLKKIEQWKAASDGPCTCDKLNDVNPGVCSECPHFKRISTPLQLGYSKPVKIEPEQVDFNAPIDSDDLSIVNSFVPPLPFILNENGAICIEVEENKTKQIKVICYNTVVPYKRIWEEVEKKEYVYFKVNTPQDGWRDVGVPLSSIQGSCPAMADIMGVGALIVNKFSGLMATYIVKCVHYMQELKAVNQSYARMGWRGESLDDDDIDRFVLNNYTFYKDGKVKREGVTDTLLSAVKDVKPLGNIDEWRKAIAVLARPGFEPHMLAFFGGFAVPLLHTTDYNGLLINLLSRDSGTFKSFTLKLITSIYGEPKFDHILSRDSVKSIYRKMGSRCDLPISYDEITNIEQHHLSDLVYAITQGREHDRLNMDSSLRENVSAWRTVLFSTSNSSLDDILGAGHIAERMRMMELSVQHCHENPPLTDMEAASIIGTLSENYGLAGMAWIQYIVENYDLLAKQCRQMIDGLMTVTDSNTDKRFWVSYVALALVAAQHTRKMGLHSFDMNSLSTYCKSLLTVSTKKVVEDKIALPLQLYDFINQNLNSMISLTYSSPSSKTREITMQPKSGKLVLIYEMRPIGAASLKGFDKTLYVSRPDMQEFLTTRRISYNDFIEEMNHDGYLTSVFTRKKITLPEGSGRTEIRGFVVDMNKFETKYGELNNDEKD